METCQLYIDPSTDGKAGLVYDDVYYTCPPYMVLHIPLSDEQHQSRNTFRQTSHHYVEWCYSNGPLQFGKRMPL